MDSIVTIDDKRMAILNAMLHLLSENGFHGTPMSMVAKQAGVATGTIYHYFSSKEEIINELYALLKQRMGDALMKNYNPEDSIKDRFFTCWLDLFDHFIANPKQFLFLEQFANSPFISAYSREENLKFYLPVILFMEESIRAGALREMDIRLMTALVYGSVASSVKIQVSGELILNSDLRQQAVTSCWDGVRAV